MQLKAQKNFDATRDRSRPVFGVGVAFIDESAAFPLHSHEIDQEIEEMKLIVSNLAPLVKQFHIASAESIYSPDSSDGKDRLEELLNVISDVTGRKDVLECIRMLCFQKGQGYSLAADIQYVDARWEIPVVLPLRDCLSEELNVLCSLDSLKTVEAFHGPRSGINALVSSFVKLLQEENHSRESTIVRTAGKLTPFHFNKMPEEDDYYVPLASQRRQKKYNLKIDESPPPESFCPICNCLLKKSRSNNEVENGKISAEINRTACCSSCQFQILPKETSSLEKFYLLLPQPMLKRAEHTTSHKERWLREQAQDFLVSHTEEGT